MKNKISFNFLNKAQVDNLIANRTKHSTMVEMIAFLEKKWQTTL